MCCPRAVAFNSFDTDGSRGIDEVRGVTCILPLVANALAWELCLCAPQFEYRNMCAVINDFDPMFAANFSKALDKFSWYGTALL